MFWRKHKDSRALIEDEDAYLTDAPPSDIDGTLKYSISQNLLYRELKDEMKQLESRLDNISRNELGLHRKIASYIIAKCPLEVFNPDWTGMIGKRVLKTDEYEAGIYYYQISGNNVESILYVQDDINKYQVSL